MAKYNQSNFTVLITSVSATTVFNDISNYITDFSGLDVEALLVQSDAFGDSWKEMLYTGINQAADITMKMFYDDAAATGPHALFGALSALGADRALKLKFGTTNEYPKFHGLIKQYRRLPKRGSLTEAELILAITGAVTNGTT